MSNFTRALNKAPDKGSFPIDHFHECSNEAVSYSKCIDEHKLIPKKCRDQQKAYLECRMSKYFLIK